ncbi:Two component system response regulator, sigma54-specific [Desulfonema limicola]|uniref:Two component system response regulator, sigma54-specific n=1 Tax=Desulfonema limicola TaxID=45656 RepID=A0A975BE10_9BACT|nr:sigma-54 dependent transcriptional regulator [Desulfonema limicola]QTA83540.1 Two component system response regulator, sigma54-specific [Desulfonema limicola]
MAKILIIDDDEEICHVLFDLIKNINHQAEYFLTLEAGVKKALSEEYDVVFLDVHMPDGNGLEALQRIRNRDLPPEVIIITGEGDADGAETAIKNGAWDYIQKPLMSKDIILPLKRVLQYRNNIKQTGKPNLILKRDSIIGSSSRIKACLDILANAARSDTNVLITGETGTGKEIFARTLHANSNRLHKSFVVVDCAALPENLVESQLFGYEKGSFTGADKARGGLIKQADNGTLFLDEVCELNLPLQKAFLRVLQERSFRPIGSGMEIKSNFRLIAATNCNPENMVEQGLLRKDLLFRLRTVHIELPPLRERDDDIRELVKYYTEQICSRYNMQPKGFAPDLLDIMCSYNWPGNIRELFHALESTITNAEYEPILFPTHLPDNIRIQTARASITRKKQIITNQSSKQPKAQFSNNEFIPTYKEFRESVLSSAEKNYLKHLMEYTRGNIKEAGRISKLGRTRLYTLMKKHNISR